jgi:hypothetical protein
VYLGSVLHDPLAWSQAEHAWGRKFSPLGFVGTIVHLPHAIGGNPWLIRDVACFGVYVALLVAARRAGTPLPWLVGAAAVVTVPLFSGSFESIGRFGLARAAIFRSRRWRRWRRSGDPNAVVLLVALTATILPSSLA